MNQYFWVKFISETINAVLHPDQDQLDSMLQTKTPFLAGSAFWIQSCCCSSCVVIQVGNYFLNNRRVFDADDDVHRRQWIFMNS